MNFNSLGTILDHLRGYLDGDLNVNQYLGNYGTMFGLHTEDLDLYSANYLPRRWTKILDYVISFMISIAT